MENKKVLLKFPFNVSDSSYYKNLIKHSPIGYDYITDIETGLINNNIKRGILKSVKHITRNMFTKFNISRPLYSSNSSSLSDIEHYAHCLPKKPKKNYVLDIEGVWQLCVGEMNDKSRKIILDILNDDKCKAILPWTNYAYNQFIQTFPELKSKTFLLRPAVPLMVNNNNKDKKFTLLYTARDFDLKNGPMACKVINEAIETFGSNYIRGIVIANVPDDIKNEYPLIEYKDLMTKEELNNYYAISDVLIYPSPVDTFGFAIIEAMSYGIPCIVSKTEYTPSVNEIIVNGYNGYAFTPEEYVKKSIKIIEKFLISNDPENLLGIKDQYDVKFHSNPSRTEFYNKMSFCCKFMMLNGPFSINHRNRKLQEILSKCH